MNITAKSALKPFRRVLTASLFLTTIGTIDALAQTTTGSPWETAVINLMNLFTGPIAKGLSVVAIVLAGLMLAFDAGHDKSVIARLIFGLGMALGSVQFMAWLFGV